MCERLAHAKGETVAFLYSDQPSFDYRYAACQRAALAREPGARPGHGFRVSAERRGGRILFVAIESRLGGPGP